MSVETGTKRKAENNELFPDENENKRKFLEASKNWSDLPAEMKMHCIKWMNFETRCQLRRTSRTEKHLVDVERYPIKLLSVVIVRNRASPIRSPYVRWHMKSAFETRRKYFDLPAIRKDQIEIEMIFRLGKIEKFQCEDLKTIPLLKYQPRCFRLIHLWTFRATSSLKSRTWSSV